MSDEYSAKIHQWIKAWNTGNLDLLDEVFAGNVVYHVPPFPDLIGLEAHKQFIASARITYPDFNFTIDEIIERDDESAIRWTWRGTFAGPSPSIPVPPTNKSGVSLGAHIVHWKNGKVVETWHIGDWLGLLTQHGVIPPMG